MTSKEMTKAKRNLELLVSEEIPDFLKGKESTGRGSEDVSAQDITIPLLKLAQSLSPELEENGGKYIEGLKAGDLFNSVTNKVYGDTILFCPSVFKMSYLIFKNRNDGGGFYGAFDNEKAAYEAMVPIAAENKSQISQFEITATANHFGIIIDNHGASESVCIPMSSTRLKTSRQLNTFISMAGGDNFDRVYRIDSIQEQSKTGNKYFNLKISNGGANGNAAYPSTEIYQKAEEIYKMVKSNVAKASSEEVAKVDDTEVPY